jgi:RND superfamily putative drug exporter
VRLIFSLGLSLLWTYGILVLVYHHGAAQDAFSRLTPLILEADGIYWIIPFVSFSILVGLALDYDIFLLSRVAEFRRMGWSDRAAVALAIQKTGPVISTAGLIILVSFVGLIVPKTLVLQQYGCVLFLGVLIDTFVIRPIIVPAMFAGAGDMAGGRANWWPRVMPAVLMSYAEEEIALLRDGLWEPPLRHSKVLQAVAQAESPQQQP